MNVRNLKFYPCDGPFLQLSLEKKLGGRRSVIADAAMMHYNNSVARVVGIARNMNVICGWGRLIDVLGSLKASVEDCGTPVPYQVKAH